MFLTPFPETHQEVAQVTQFWYDVGNSVVTSVFNRAIKPIYESERVQNWIGQSMVWGQRKVVEMATKSLTKTPKEEIVELVTLLKDLKTKVSEELEKYADGAYVNAPEEFFTQEEIATIRQPIVHFLDNSEKLMDKARTPDGKLIPLNESSFEKILEVLTSNSPNLRELDESVSNTIELLESVRNAQTGPLAGLTPILETASPTTAVANGKNTKKLQHDFKRLLDALQALNGAVVPTSDKGKEDNVTVFQEEAHAKALEAYEAFMTHSKTIFMGKGYQEFKGLCESLNEPLHNNRFTADQMETLQNAIEFLQTLSASPDGYIETARNVLTSFSIKKILSAIGITNPDQDALLRTHEKSKMAQREALQRINRVKPKEAPPAELTTSLEQKIDNIGDLSFKMILTKLIFNNETWKETFYQICQDVENREKSDATSKNEAFFKALEHHFTLDELADSYSNRAWKWIYLNMAAPVIKSYLEYAIAEIKKDLIQFLEMTPTEKIQNVFRIVLNPLNAHMTEFSTFVPNLRGEVVDSYDKRIESHFDSLIDAKLSRFAHAAIEKYTYSVSLFNLRYNLNAILSMGAAVLTAVSFIQGYRTSIKVAGIMTTYLFSGAFEAMLNLGVKYVAKWELRKVVKKDVLTTDPALGKVHSRLQHILNEQLLEKLIDFNARGADISSKPMKLTSSPTTQVEMDTIVRQLFATIPLSLASTTSDAFHSHFDQPNVSERVKTEFFSMIRLFSPSISTELLKRMENLLSDEKTLSEFVWNALNAIEKSLTSGAKATDATQMDTTETQLVEHLEMAVEKVVEQGVKLALDPSKKLQDEINGTLEHTKGLIAAFVTSFKTMNAENFAEKNQEFSQLCPAFLDATTKFKGTPKIEPHCTRLLEDFLAVTKQMTTSMNEIENLLQTRKDDQEKLKVLNTIRDRLQYKKDAGVISFDASKNVRTLDILSEKRWLTEELKEKINPYKDCLETYLRTKADRPLTEQVHRWTDDFLTHLDTEIQHLGDNIEKQTAGIERNIDLLKKQEIEKLAAWAETQLKPMTIRSKDVASRAASLIEGIPVERYASPLINYFIRELIRYKNKPYHWKGIISNVAAAYGSTTIRA